MQFVYVVMKGAVLEKSYYHKRSFEHGAIINARFISNPKKANTQCYSTSNTILAKIPIQLLEENVRKNVRFFFLIFFNI